MRSLRTKLIATATISAAFSLGTLSPALAADAPTLFVHLTATSWSGCETIDPESMDCSDIVVEGNSSGYQFAFVMAGGVPAISGAQFGISYDGTVDVADWSLCTGGMSIPEDSWPTSGKAIAVTWPETVFPAGDDSLVVIGFFTIEPSSSGALEVTADDRIEQAVYTDDATEQHGFSALGVADVDGDEAGTSPCGQEQGEGDSAGGSDDNGESDDSDDTAGGDGGESGGGSDNGSGPLVMVLLQPGVFQFEPPTVSGTIDDANISSAAIESVLVAHDVLQVSKVYPEFTLSDTLGVARTGETVHLTNRAEYYFLAQSEEGDPDQLVADLSEQPGTRLAFFLPDVEGQPTIALNDSLYTSQWGLENTGQDIAGDPFADTPPLDGGTPGVDIEAQNAWGYTTGSSDVLVTIFDEGMDQDHEDLVGRVEGDPAERPNSHAYYVAGVLAANPNNRVGIVGVDWHARILSKDYLHTSGRPIKIEEAVEAGSQLGNVSYEGIYPTAFRGNWRDAYMLGFLTVGTMGNIECEEVPDDEHEFIHYPGQFTAPGILACGAIDYNDEPVYCNGPAIDVVAPGSEVWTTQRQGRPYKRTSGTSVAAPHVAGIASLLLARDPSLYNDDLEQLIRLSCDNIIVQGEDEETGWDEITGMGRVNARRALSFLSSPYQVVHGETVGGTVVDSTALYRTKFMISPGSGMEPYLEVWVKRKTVYSDQVTFPVSFTQGTPNVWGRASATDGYSIDEHPPVDAFDNPRTPENWAIGWCEPVPGTVDLDGCVLRTYVYDIYNDQFQFLGRQPADIPLNELAFGYTAHGWVVDAVATEGGEESRPFAVAVAGPHPATRSRGARVLVHLPHASHAELAVYDVSGRRVRRLFDGTLREGDHRMFWNGQGDNGQGVPAGVYYIHAVSDAGVIAKQVVLLR